MKQSYRAALAAGLLVLAACGVSRPRLDHPDPLPIPLDAALKPEVEAQVIRRAAAERKWSVVQESPGHVVVAMTREAYNLSIRMDIVYGSDAIRMKLLELVNTESEPLAQNQIDDYERWTEALRSTIAQAHKQQVLKSRSGV